MRFSILASGSAGNATLVVCGADALLIDCGLSVRQIEMRLQALVFPGTAIRAIILTHEHDDHLAGAAAFSRKYCIPIYASSGTRRAAGARLAPAHSHVVFAPEREFAVGPFTLAPVIVPHDAREPCQFVVSAGRLRLGILTDTGQITPHVLRHFRDLDALILEFNHEVELLANSAYPRGLQARIAGQFGHLSNVQAAEMLARLDLSGLRHVIAAHLSEKTNRVALVERYLRECLPAHVGWSVASQQAALPWHELTPAEQR